MPPGLQVWCSLPSGSRMPGRACEAVGHPQVRAPFAPACGDNPAGSKAHRLGLTALAGCRCVVCSAAPNWTRLPPLLPSVAPRLGFFVRMPRAGSCPALSLATIPASGSRVGATPALAIGLATALLGVAAIVPAGPISLASHGASHREDAPDSSRRAYIVFALAHSDHRAPGPALQRLPISCSARLCS